MPASSIVLILNANSVQRELFLDKVRESFSKKKFYLSVKQHIKGVICDWRLVFIFMGKERKIITWKKYLNRKTTGMQCNNTGEALISVCNHICPGEHICINLYQ